MSLRSIICRLYDWQLILGFLAWAVPHKGGV